MAYNSTIYDITLSYLREKNIISGSPETLCNIDILKGCLHHYLDSASKSSEVSNHDGVLTLTPKKSFNQKSLKGIVNQIGLHPGEVASGLFTAMTYMALSDKGLLTKPVHIVLPFVEEAKSFILKLEELNLDLGNLQESGDKARLDKLVREVRFVDGIEPNLIFREQLKENSEYKTQRIYNELKPLYLLATHFKDDHSVTANINFNGSVQEFASINPASSMDKVKPFLPDSPIKIVMTNYLISLNDETGRETLKSWVQDIAGSNCIVLGTENGSHISDKSISNAVMFTGNFIEKSGALDTSRLQQDPLSPKKQTFYFVETPNRVLVPMEEGEQWYITKEVAELMKHHGNTIEPNTLLAFSEDGKEFRSPDHKIQLFFPGHENLRDKVTVDENEVYKMKTNRIGTNSIVTEHFIGKDIGIY